MKKHEAQELVEKTLEHSFNQDKFSELISNIFKEVKEDHRKPSSGNHIAAAFRDYISSVKRIASYENTTENLNVDILVVKLVKKTSLERARATQRNFIASLLKKGDKDAALVAFVSPDGADWRFSFVKMEYKFDQQGKIEEKFTHARRHSFLVGPNEDSHTAKSRLLPALKQCENPTLKDLENIFNVEKVTKEFFEKYRELFHRLNEQLDDICEKDPKVSNEFKKRGIGIADFAKKLLGQIVFLYFLQKKGWFGVPRDEKWGGGSKKFLRELFEKEHGDYANFFNDILEPLFYEALSRKHTDDYYSRFDCRIPFLNGGLFDPINQYNWVDVDITLSDDIFSNGDETGILDIFDRYNFTVNENEPLEKEVAVDPEMLGKVFENLLKVKDRKSKGTYYTPREIVHYMCRESLANYLATELKGKVNKADIQKLLKYGENVAENESHIVRRGGETKTYKHQLPDSVCERQNAKCIDDKLATIRVCDPAVGSGAFLVGMMNEIVRVRNTLSSYINKGVVRPTYYFKREAIKNCLYGVDVDSSATEIAKLRLWLSLIVDEEYRSAVKPLPNLDYKVIQGNSLLSVETDIFNNDLLVQLKDLKHSYFNETDTDEKRDRRRQINELFNQITDLDYEMVQGYSPFSMKKNALSPGQFEQLEELKQSYINETDHSQKQEYRKQIYRVVGQDIDEYGKFDFKVYFSEVFHEKQGFDVVIGNPPYVSVKEISQRDKEKFSDLFDVGKGRFNLFTLFLEKGHKLLRPSGILTYILPVGLYSSVEYRFVRDYLLSRSSVQFINLFSNRVFDAAVDTSVISVTNGQKPHHKIPVFRDLGELSVEWDQQEVKQLPFAIFPVNVTQEYKPILSRLVGGDFEQLKNVLEIQQGIIYSGLSKAEVFSNIQTSETHKRVLDGRDILKWKINWEEKRENRYINYSDKLHRPREERIFLAEEKLLLPRKATKIFVAYDDTQYYALNTAYLCLPKGKKFNLKYILACLNSKLINRFYSLLFFGWQITIPALNLVPIPAANEIKQKPFIEIVDNILAITGTDDYQQCPTKQAQVCAYEKDIDKLVYDLYDLTPDEIKIIKESNNPK